MVRSKKTTNGLLESFLTLLARGHRHCILLGAKNIATTTLLNSLPSPELTSSRLARPLRLRPSYVQPGSYQLTRWISTDKRACIDWYGHSVGEQLGSKCRSVPAEVG